MLKPLADLYWDMIWAWPLNDFFFFDRGIVANWLQTHYDLERAQARRVARILHNWVWFGYEPARYAGVRSAWPF